MNETCQAVIDTAIEPSTPGFELIALAAALGSSLVLVRRRN